MSFTYNNLVPATNNDPSADQPQMLINTQSINSIIAVDHIGFNAGNGGYHKVIRQQNQVSTDPAPIAGINQVYAKNYTPDTTGGTADTQLFAITGVGGISQITGYSTSNSTDGWQWVGGILIQWGQVSSPGSSGTVTFKDRVAGAIPFPNNLFVVNLTYGRNGSISTGHEMYVDTAATFSKLQFSYRALTSGNAKMFWIAIGN